VGVVRERGRTADNRVIKAELHPPNWAGHPVTVYSSRLVVMTWVSKHWLLLLPYVHVRWWRMRQLTAPYAA